MINCRIILCLLLFVATEVSFANSDFGDKNFNSNTQANIVKKDDGVKDSSSFSGESGGAINLFPHHLTDSTSGSSSNASDGDAIKAADGSASVDNKNIDEAKQVQNSSVENIVQQNSVANEELRSKNDSGNKTDQDILRDSGLLKNVSQKGRGKKNIIQKKTTRSKKAPGKKATNLKKDTLDNGVLKADVLVLGDEVKSKKQSLKKPNKKSKSKNNLTPKLENGTDKLVKDKQIESKNKQLDAIMLNAQKENSATDDVAKKDDDVSQMDLSTKPQNTSGFQAEVPQENNATIVTQPSIPSSGFSSSDDSIANDSESSNLQIEQTSLKRAVKCDNSLMKKKQEYYLNGRVNTEVMFLINCYTKNGMIKELLELYYEVIKLLNVKSKVDDNLDSEVSKMLESYFAIIKSQSSIDSEVYEMSLDRLGVLFSSNSDILSAIGSVFLLKNLNEKAIDYFNKSLSVDMDNEVSLYNIAVAYDKIGDMDRAMIYYQQLLAKASDSDDSKKHEFLSSASKRLKYLQSVNY